MNAARVILVTVAGPAGQMDVGVRSDATAPELAAALGSMLGVSLTRSVAEHRSPPRPGSRQGQRAMLSPATSLAAAGVADGDLILFRRTEEGLGRAPAPPHGVLRNPVPSAAQPGLPRGTRPSQAGSPGTVPPPRPAAEPQAGPLPRADSLPRGAPPPHGAPTRRPAPAPYAGQPPAPGPPRHADPPPATGSPQSAAAAYPGLAPRADPPRHPDLPSAPALPATQPPAGQPPATHAPTVPPAALPSWLGSSGATPAPQPDPRDGVTRPALPRHARANDPADAAAVPEEETRPHDRH